MSYYGFEEMSADSKKALLGKLAREKALIQRRAKEQKKDEEKQSKEPLWPKNEQ